jgi:hypothetical protein
MLAEALQHAQLAVKLDTTGSDMSAIITAYDETIALLERVIARRTHKPGTNTDVERVTDIVSSRPPPNIPPVREKKNDRSQRCHCYRFFFRRRWNRSLFSYCDVRGLPFFSMTDIRTVYVSFV